MDSREAETAKIRKLNRTFNIIDLIYKPAHFPLFLSLSLQAVAYFSFTAARFQPDTLLPVGDYPSPAATTTSFTWIPTRREASAWNKSNGARDFLVRIRFLTLITPSVIAFPPLARKGRVVFSRSRRYRRRGWSWRNWSTVICVLARSWIFFAFGIKICGDTWWNGSDVWKSAI